ncbi:IS1 family transposase, partial [Klebsiella pneumoniae]|nr:IS1 family transposase [Klebsiella pneumoniae]MCF0853433.1 IS1 family transposase [Klebsiella pneumoniae]MCF0897778.1 IS1 family transposase [Klebsiella pneumoniae]MCF0914093.1 IS1 family transposase [Klebsiella pneumoniae]
AENTDDLFVGKTLLHGDVLMWLMKTLLTSGCTNQRGAGQRIERHNLNLRQHLARLGRKSLSFSKSVELHDKVIEHYLSIKHYQ